MTESVTDQGDVCDVIPDVGEIVVSGYGERAHETVERHVVLLSVEAAKTDVVVQLRIVHAHLQQPPDTARQDRPSQFYADPLRGCKTPGSSRHPPMWL